MHLCCHTLDTDTCRFQPVKFECYLDIKIKCTKYKWQQLKEKNNNSVYCKDRGFVFPAAVFTCWFCCSSSWGPGKVLENSPRLKAHPSSSLCSLPGSPAGSSCSGSAASWEAAHWPVQHPWPHPHQQQTLHHKSGKTAIWNTLTKKWNRNKWKTWHYYALSCVFFFL